MSNSANMLRTDEDWEGCTCHLVSHRIDIFYLLDDLSKLTQVIKNVNLLQPIYYIKKYIDVPQYVVHLFIEHNISIFLIYRYVVAIPTPLK